jgi:hypothetical protein
MKHVTYADTTKFVSKGEREVCKKCVKLKDVFTTLAARFESTHF